MTRDDVRAAAILVMVGVQAVGALPVPPAVRAHDPAIRDEATRVGALFAAVGVDTSGEALSRRARAVVARYAAARATLLGPLRPFFRLTGTGQAWGLFAYPDRYPVRLVVEGRAGEGEWTRLYAAHDPEATFGADVFTYRRIRGVYDGNAERGTRVWERFCTWAALEVFAARPEVTEVRVSFRRVHTFEPGEGPDTLVEEGEGGVRVRRRP